MGTKRYMLLVHGFSASVAATALALAAFGSAGGSATARAAGIAVMVFTVVVVVLALVAVGRAYGELIAGLRSGSRLLTSAAADAQTATTSRAAAAAEQSGAVAEISATIEQLAATATAIADSSRAVSDGARRTLETTRAMRETVESVSERVRTLSESSQQIDRILVLIDEIAEQTNLLALNAAIEAARAGDAGAGFAVVAGEVRKLAARSLESSSAIAALVERIRREAATTVLASEDGARQVRSVGTLMEETERLLEDAVEATEQQRRAADQVTQAVLQIRGGAEQVATDRARHADAARELSDRADALVTILARLGAGPQHSAGTAGNFVRRNVYESGLPLALLAAGTASLSLGRGGAGFAAGLALGVGGVAFLVWIRWFRVRRLLQSLREIRSGIDGLRSLVATVDEGTASVAAATSEQSAAVAQTTSTVEELAATAASIAANAREAGAAAGQTAATMEEMHQTVAAIAGSASELQAGSREIDQILVLIDEIAEQTNLLALNAAIEAARAGGAGKGFGVVAAEVTKLAERALESNDAIRGIVRLVKGETDAVVSGTEASRRQVREVVELMEHTASMLEEAVVATEQQQAAGRHVATAIVQIRASAEELAAEQGGERVPLEHAVAALETGLDSMVGTRHRLRARRGGTPAAAASAAA